MRIPDTAVLVSAVYAPDEYGVRRSIETEKPYTDIMIL